MFVYLDIDAGRNKDIRYTLQNDANVPDGFTINKYSGQINLNKGLDRETRPIINLIATATDQGIKPRHTSINVVITVTDYNDNAPVFSGKKSFEIQENVAKGTHVFTVTVTDADEGKFFCLSRA